jgi:hypothetical protein
VVGTSDGDTIRKCLNEQLTAEVLPELERCLNAALAAEIATTIWHRARDIAIDFHDQPYLISPPTRRGGCTSTISGSKPVNDARGGYVAGPLPKTRPILSLLAHRLEFLLAERVAASASALHSNTRAQRLFFLLINVEHGNQYLVDEGIDLLIGTDQVNVYFLPHRL